MTDPDLTPEAVERPLDEVFDTQRDVEQNPCGAWQAIQALSTALEADRARADAAEARERALLTTYDEDRKALVENTSLRSRLKAAEAKLKEAVDAATGLADWIEHEAGCELPFDARALRAPLDNPNK